MKKLSTLLLVLIFFAGLSILLYPSVSDYINSKTQSRAIADYDSVVSELETEDFTSVFEQADEYNLRLRQTNMSFFDPSLVPGYLDALNVSSTGIMGYVTIDKIKVELPVYHSVDDSVLQIAVGHLEGTSLPVGGESTHCVLSAHRGLPSAKLFSNLDKLELGDVFTITVLNRLLTYEVDQIRIVEPNDVEELQIKEGKDYCTLVTCTPYGVNSHRLLVRGKRIENAVVKPDIHVSADAFIVDPLIVTPVIAAPMLLVLLIVLLVKYRKKK